MGDSGGNLRAHWRPNARTRTRDTKRAITAVAAAEAFGPIQPMCEIYCLTMGQFSLIDVIEHVLASTGPADLVVSTWTAAGADVTYARALLNDGRVRSCRWLLDKSFPTRQPGYLAALRDRFGDDSIRLMPTHAKFVLVGNDDWSVVIRTSANLNRNTRIENYEISDDPGLYDYLLEVVAAWWDQFGDGEQFSDGYREVDSYHALTTFGQQLEGIRRDESTFGVDPTRKGATFL